jgi:hypothetical protein
MKILHVFEIFAYLYVFWCGTLKRTPCGARGAGAAFYMKTADLLNISFTVRWPGRPLAYIILDGLSASWGLGCRDEQGCIQDVVY